MTSLGSTRSRSRRSTRPSGDDRERAILTTAERLLEQRPLAEISVDDLAKGAGISRPTFYFYFKSKDAVLLSLLEPLIAAADENFVGRCSGCPVTRDGSGAVASKRSSSRSARIARSPGPHRSAGHQS